MKNKVIILMLCMLMASPLMAGEVKTVYCETPTVFAFDCPAVDYLRFLDAQREKDYNKKEQLMNKSKTVRWYLENGWDIIDKEKVPGMIQYDYIITIRKK